MLHKHLTFLWRHSQYHSCSIHMLHSTYRYGSLLITVYVSLWFCVYHIGRSTSMRLSPLFLSHWHQPPLFYLLIYHAYHPFYCYFFGLVLDILVFHCCGTIVIIVESFICWFFPITLLSIFIVEIILACLL